MWLLLLLGSHIARASEMQALQAIPAIPGVQEDEDEEQNDDEENALAEELANEVEATPVVEWETPKQYTQNDFRALSGKAGPLTITERFVLDFTNLQISEGGERVNLEENYKIMITERPKLYSEADAIALGGKDAELLSPLEKTALRQTNEQILTGAKNTNLEENYKVLLENYRNGQAHQDAKTIYVAIDGGGTDEDKVLGPMVGKAQPEIKALREAFSALLKEKGESGTLLSWIDGDMDGGWYQMAFDAYSSKPIKENAEYFHISAIAKWWNSFIKASDEGAQAMIEHGNLLEQGIGLFNQALLGSAQAVNSAVDTSQKYWLSLMKPDQYMVVRAIATAEYVLATLVGSLGTKAFDPSLGYDETEEGLTDLAILIVTWGAAKLVQAGAKTALGIRALSALSKVSRKMSIILASVRRALRLMPRSEKFTALAAKFRMLAKSTKNAARAKKALQAADKLDDAARAAKQAQIALDKAKEASDIARKLMKNADSVADDVTSAVKRSIEAGKTAEKEVLALRDAQKAVTAAMREASWLRNTAAYNAARRAREILTTPLGERARIIRGIASKLNKAQGDDVAAALRKITDHLKNQVKPGAPMTGKQFNEFMDALEAFGSKYGIRFTRTTEAMGVYPKGLYELRLAGFSKMDDLSGLVSFGQRHEVAHIVHTLQTRATLLESIKAGKITVKEAEAFLRAIEKGSNYRQFEKAVTGISGGAHRTARTQAMKLYLERVDELIAGTERGLYAGAMRFPTGKTFEEVYALFMSKAPLVVGKSLKELAMRFPAIAFAAIYAANTRASGYGLNPARVGLSWDAGFRDYVNALITKGYH